MSNLEALHVRAKALNLHGLLAHWGEAAAAGWLATKRRDIKYTSMARGVRPPIHMPFFLEAAILSRMRSPVTSRSNWANDRRILSVRRPIDDVVLNCWVTDTKETACLSKMSTISAKSDSDRVSRSTL